MIERFFWVWNFRLWDFLGYENLAWVAWFEEGFLGGIKKNQMRKRIYSDGMMNKQTRVFNFRCFFFVISHYPFLELLGATKSAWDFLGVNFWSRDFFGSWLLAPFDHPRHLKSRVPPPGQSSRENATPSSGTSPLASYKVGLHKQKRDTASAKKGKVSLQRRGV